MAESLTYDQIGNIATRGGLAYSYDPSHKHAVSSFNGVSYGYDPNGSMIVRGAQSVVYDADNRPAQMDTEGDIPCEFAYDGDGKRLKRSDAIGSVHYVGSFEKNVTSGEVTKYYQAGFGKGSRLIAFRKGSDLQFVGTDHLGSTILVTDASFTSPSQMRYSPFGQGRDGSLFETDHRFTSQIEDVTVGLYWYNARAYDPIIGRFTQPDTIVPEAGNPQSLNRYSYTLNSPTNNIDPDGHDPIGPEWVAEYEQAHGSEPNDQDREDRLVSWVAANARGKGWNDTDWQNYTELKQSGLVNNVLNGTVGNRSERVTLAAALWSLAFSGSTGAEVFSYLTSVGATVKFGSGPIPNTSMAWNGVIYIHPSLLQERSEVIAAYIAHEAYHIKCQKVASWSLSRSGYYPMTLTEETGAFSQEARAWKDLRVTYTGNNAAPYDWMVENNERGTMREYVRDNYPIYRTLPYVP